MRNAWLLLLLSLQSIAWAQSYELSWWTIDGGGGKSAGGPYALTGTIGQPDAGGPMTGGNYSLIGGFWSLSYALQPEGVPRLTITTAGADVILSWPSPSTGFQLEAAASLTAPSWAEVGAVVSDDGTTRSVTLAVAPGETFYRLHKVIP